MLTGLKQLSLVSKILFIISLIILFVWVIPTMVNYFKTIQAQERQVTELQKSFSKYGIIEDAKKFNKESFVQDALKYVSKASIELLEENSYVIKLEVEKDKIANFSTFLETVSLRYLIEITSPVTFKEKEKLIEVKMSIREL